MMAEEYLNSPENMSYLRRRRTDNALPEGERVRMKYRAYKRQYPGFHTVPGTYDPETKTVEVIVPARKTA